MSQIQENNNAIFHKLSVYLNFESRFITSSMMQELTEECGLKPTEAFAMLLAARMGLDIGGADRALFDRYFSRMIHHCNVSVFANDPYLLTVRIPDDRDGEWSFREMTYAPYEAFVYDDPVTLFDGTVIPQIGFFDTAFHYPAVLQDGREWMTVTPNEIRTMQSAIAAAHGHVLTYGLGLGYFAFMAARKTEVTRVTVIERDPHVIRLFRSVILPQLPCRDKINIIEDDAIHFATSRIQEGDYHMVFADIWHDPSDGTDAYLRLKACEKNLPSADYHYWIEKTLKLYL